MRPMAIFVQYVKGKFHSITCHKCRNRKQRYSSTLSLTSAVDVFIYLDIYVYIIIVFITYAARETAHNKLGFDIPISNLLQDRNDSLESCKRLCHYRELTDWSFM
jgi:hypothetical protein